MDMKTGKGFLEHIAKYICGVLIFIVIITMTSCSDSFDKKAAGVAATAVPTVLSAPPSNTLEFSVEKDRIDIVAIVINSHSGNSFQGNRAKIHDKKGIDDTIQMLNSIEVYPKEESYKYYGGDSPEVMINFFDDKDDVVERMNIYLDLKLNEYVLRFRENNYKIYSSEIDKIHEICELYDDIYRKDRTNYGEADSGKKRRKGLPVAGFSKKRIPGILILFVAACFSLTACSSKNIRSADENIPQSSVPAVDAQETEASEETDELSGRLERYKAFLRDEVSSEDKKEKQFWYLRDFCSMVVPEETEAGIRYALFDMTGDELPELHVLTDISYSIHTIENDKLITWYQGDRYNSPLNNGMILWKGSSESAGEGYMVLDSKGAEVSSVWFGKNGNDYRFATGDEDIKLSKRQWEKLKKPFLAVGSDQIIWKNISDIDLDVDYQDYYKKRGDQ